ncbi:hypothetical protein [Prosthecobacter fluviatilis]|uniref:Uncharacterized protein n=1 Tax=Prosthecobacter fluviatilis TaxID=445931 RepID=A0ABW0KLU1_9BACT
MDESKLRQLAKTHLLPWFSGASIDQKSVKSSTKDAQVAFVDPCTIAFKAQSEDSFRLHLKRSQAFDNLGGGKLAEIDLVKAFVQVVGKMQGGLNSWYQADLASMFPRRVIAKSLCSVKVEEEAFLSVLDQMSLWAGRQYEGRPIAAAIGFSRKEFTGGTHFRDICDHDFSAVLSNGFDTMLICDFNGKICGHEQLKQPPHPPPFSPNRLQAIAEWANDGNIAIALNRSGDILIFRSKELVFARRSGKWHYLKHSPILTQMGKPSDKIVRQAVYESALDASFARTGACIGVVLAANSKKWKDIATSRADYLSPASSPKGRAIASMVNGVLFQNLDRRLRQELLAIDGATIIDHKGVILAVGAILKIKGGSTGGGRLAAARALSALGVGIKVSQDGGIRGFHETPEDIFDDVTEVFSIM